MTEQLFPDDMANGLVDGTLPPEAVAADLRTAADVLRAAHQPATAEELSGAAAMVQLFTAAVAPTATARAVDSTTHPNRSTTMFATRITRRAASVVAITLLAAGTAAAAAGGALPSFGSDAPSVAPRPEDEPTTSEGSGDTTTTTTEVVGDTTTTEASTTTTEETTTTSSEPLELTDELMVEMRNENRSLKGKCTAWTNGAPKDPTVPGFVELQVAADEVGATIDDFCDAMLAAYDHEDDDEGDDDGDESEESESEKGNKGNKGNKDKHESKGQGNGRGNGNQSGNDD